MTSDNPLLATLAELCASSPTPWGDVLAAVTKHFDCPVGTIHLLDPADGMLHLAAFQGLPQPVLEKVQVIPIGKGMAGIAAERREPVQMCNLQTDDSGVARPNARLTKMEGSIAAPMMAGERLFGVLGVAKPVPYDFTAEESALLMQCGAALSGSTG
ncbi:MAG: GAF domain-containing protein [Planctomycetota bacterium]